MKINSIIIGAAILATLLLSASPAEAQLFGERPLGDTLSRRPSPGSASQLEAAAAASQGEGMGGLTGSVGASVGELTGIERFLRGNRSRSDFVGSDLLDRPGFIGSVQGNTRGIIRSAITNLRPLVNEQINRMPPEPLTRQARPYAPRYQVNFDYPLPATADVEASLSRQMLRIPGMERLGPIEVSVAGQTAILRGAVASEHQRDVAEQLVLLEPGIREVQNELYIAAPAAASSAAEVPGLEPLAPASSSAVPSAGAPSSAAPSVAAPQPPVPGLDP
jgi:hypothetical protein